jgi:hypothetical protein
MILMLKDTPLFEDFKVDILDLNTKTSELFTEV